MQFITRGTKLPLAVASAVAILLSGCASGPEKAFRSFTGQLKQVDDKPLCLAYHESKDRAIYAEIKRRGLLESPNLELHVCTLLREHGKPHDFGRSDPWWVYQYQGCTQYSWRSNDPVCVRSARLTFLVGDDDMIADVIHEVREGSDKEHFE